MYVFRNSLESRFPLFQLWFVNPWTEHKRGKNNSILRPSKKPKMQMIFFCLSLWFAWRVKEAFGSKRLSVIIDMKGRGRTAFWQAYEGLRGHNYCLLHSGKISVIQSEICQFFKIFGVELKRGCAWLLTWKAGDGRLFWQAYMRDWEATTTACSTVTEFVLFIPRFFSFFETTQFKDGPLHNSPKMILKGGDQMSFWEAHEGLRGCYCCLLHSGWTIVNTQPVISRTGWQLRTKN